MRQINKKDLIVMLASAVVLAVFIAVIFGLMHSVEPAQEAGVTAQKAVTEQQGENTTQKKAVKIDPLLTLVNNQNPLPEDWEVELETIDGGLEIDKAAYDGLTKMLEDAREQGYDPIVCSAYRSEERQEELFDNKVEQYIAEGKTQDEAEELAKTWVNEPGTSEHAMGYAADIVSYSYQLLEENQEDTATQQWLMENCYKYGFILRYPKDKVDITGVNYEPWHYRYVGKANAKKIQKSGLCLEEYVELMYPGYAN
jgi:D-alanyl-D-alanine carboxypeptidase